MKKYKTWIVFVLTFIMIVLLNYYVQWRCLDSDMASEMVLADLLNKEGSILSKSWYYSTEVRVLCEQVWFQLGLLLSPNNWRIARLVGHTINMAIYISSFLFFIYSTSIKEKGIWIAIILLFPFDLLYLFHITFGGFYICHTVGLFVMLGLVLRYTNNKKTFELILLFICGILFGLNGIKILLYFTAPSIICVVILNVYQYIKEINNNKIHNFSLSCFISCISTTIGVLIYLCIISKEYSCSSPFDMFWGTVNISNILFVISNYLQSLGFINSDVFVLDVKVLSIIGLFGIFGILNIIVFIFSFSSLLKKRYFKSCSEKILFIFILSSYIVGIFAFGLTREPSNGTYWLPFIPFAFVIIELFIETIDFYRLIEMCARKIVLFSFLLCSFANTYLYLRDHPRSYDNLHYMTDILLKNNCDTVICEFWLGNAITEYSNGKIEAFIVDDYKEMNLYHYLQNKEHSFIPHGESIYYVIPHNIEYNSSIKDYKKSHKLIVDDGLIAIFEAIN